MLSTPGQTCMQHSQAWGSGHQLWSRAVICPELLGTSWRQGVRRENCRPEAMRTEGKVSAQKHRTERSVWFGERKRVAEKRPPTGGQGSLGRSCCRSRARASVGSAEAGAGVRKGKAHPEKSAWGRTQTQLRREAGRDMQVFVNAGGCPRTGRWEKQPAEGEQRRRREKRRQLRAGAERPRDGGESQQRGLVEERPASSFTLG